MKRIKLSAAMTAILFGLSLNTASAKSWRVNHDTTTGANFASINDAMSAKDTDGNDLVVAGDTLYLDPGLITSATATINKRVTIIGTGYLRTSSPHQFAKISHNLTITAEGTKVEGVYIHALLYLHAPNITIERCYIVGRITSTSENCKKHTGITYHHPPVLHFGRDLGLRKHRKSNSQLDNREQYHYRWRIVRLFSY